MVKFLDLPSNPRMLKTLQVYVHAASKKMIELQKIY